MLTQRCVRTKTIRHRSSEFERSHSLALPQASSSSTSRRNPPTDQERRRSSSSTDTADALLSLAGKSQGRSRGTTSRRLAPPLAPKATSGLGKANRASAPRSPSFATPDTNVSCSRAFPMARSGPPACHRISRLHSRASCSFQEPIPPECHPTSRFSSCRDGTTRWCRPTGRAPTQNGRAPRTWRSMAAILRCCFGRPKSSAPSASLSASSEPRRQRPLRLSGVLAEGDPKAIASIPTVPHATALRAHTRSERGTHLMARRVAPGASHPYRSRSSPIRPSTRRPRIRAKKAIAGGASATLRATWSARRTRAPHDPLKAPKERCLVRSWWRADDQHRSCRSTG